LSNISILSVSISNSCFISPIYKFYIILVSKA
jgi:hypothetical protein